MPAPLSVGEADPERDVGASITIGIYIDLVDRVGVERRRKRGRQGVHVHDEDRSFGIRRLLERVHVGDVQPCVHAGRHQTRSIQMICHVTTSSGSADGDPRRRRHRWPSGLEREACNGSSDRIPPFAVGPAAKRAAALRSRRDLSRITRQRSRTWVDVDPPRGDGMTGTAILSVFVAKHKGSESRLSPGDCSDRSRSASWDRSTGSAWVPPFPGSWWLPPGSGFQRRVASSEGSGEVRR